VLNVAVIGCGYWGPNLIRNFVTCPKTELIWACDLDEDRLRQVLSPYPNVKPTTHIEEILRDNNTQAVGIVTPVHTHYPIAKACLEAGKHVLIEKPLATNLSQGEELVRLAKEKNLKLLCDHTFCYKAEVHKIKEIVESGMLGELLYLDSIRVNLGLFQQDINVVWDLAPHDLSILDFLVPDKPILVSAHGACHTGNGIENIAYVFLRYPTNFVAHFHLDWLSPVKIRRMIIGGSKKMLVWNDMESDEKIKIYDKGIELKRVEREEREKVLVSYRSGDIYAPMIDQVEALSLVVREFADCIEENRPALTDGESGLRILRVLESSAKSIQADGVNIRIEYPKEV
jgi:predicted dehydrogenase